jgi:3-oxoacyl-[acyl-carrier protein] reductase
MSILDDCKVDGKVAVVTGGGRGIGQASALALAQGGARIVIADVDPGPANETLELLKGMGAEGAVAIGDVRKKADVEGFVKTAMDKFGSLEIMANIAGITKDGMLHKMPEDQWDFVIDINLKGTFFCCQAAMNVMRDLAKAEGAKKKARKIVNLSSIAGIYGNKGQTNYSAAKAGIIGMTKSIAYEGTMFNVQANVIAPGWIDTRLTREKTEGSTIGIPSADRQQTLMYMQFMNIRMGEPIDIARVVYFLSCDMSNYITGECINVSGGLKT